MFASRYMIAVLVLIGGLLTSPVIYHFFKGNLVLFSFPAEEANADAVMVFTGSPDRLVQGYESYLRGEGKKLMITGRDYPKDAKKAEVRRLSRQVNKNKVYIDLKARNTIENAKNGAAWALKNNVKSILLVTTEEHMSRAYFELHRLLPSNVKIYTDEVPGDIDYPGMDSETGRLVCRMYETATDTSFCYKTRNIVRNIERHLT